MTNAVLAKLGDYGLKKSGSSWMARCPAHPDTTASLSVSEGTSQPVVLHCHAGCDPDLILDALGLTWADVSTEREQAKSDRPEISTTYDYVDEAGDLLYQVVRMVPKSFRQRRPDGKGGWVWKLEDVRRPPYRLPEVLAAVAAGDPIFVVEGEKDVEAIRREGFVATCNSGGAGKWTEEHTTCLQGATVVVVADRDGTGRRHAQAVARALDSVAAEVRCAEPVEGKDVADHLAAGRTLEELAEVLDEWEADLAEPDHDPGPDEPPVDDESAPPEERESVLDRLRNLLLTGTTVKSIPSRRSLVKGWLDMNSLAMLYGRSGGGKSFTAIDMALHVVTGSWWYGAKVRKGTVLYVVAEGATGIADRQTAWEKRNNHYTPVDGIFWLPRPVNLLDVVNASALATLAVELGVSMVVIDTLARSMSGGDENAGKDMSRVIEAADHIKTKTGACVLVVHHSGKDEAAGARGWSGIKGAVDTELELKSAENILILTTTKQKDGAELQPMRFTLVPERWGCPECDGKGFLPDTGEECDRCDGDQEVGSVAIAKYTGQVARDAGVMGRAQSTLDALVSIDTGDGVSSAQWQEVAHEQGVSKASFFRHRKSLIEARLVHQVGTPVRPRFAIMRPAESDEGVA